MISRWSAALVFADFAFRGAKEVFFLFGDVLEDGSMPKERANAWSEQGRQIFEIQRELARRRFEPEFLGSELLFEMDDLYALVDGALLPDICLAFDRDLLGRKHVDTQLGELSLTRACCT
jgi:hypothetical protein